MIFLGQADVIELLEKKRRPMSAREISEALNMAFVVVSCNIRKLVQNEEIKVLELTREQAAQKFNVHYKRRMRLYYC